VTVTPADDLAGDSVTLAVEADWLICRIECIPGSAELSLTLPVRAAPPSPSRFAARFERDAARTPEAVDWPATFTTDGSAIGGRITLGGGNGESAELRVDWLTGRVVREENI